MSSVPEIAALKQRGGDSEGGRMIQLQADATRCAVREAIQKARASTCCPVPVSRTVVPLESTNLQAQLAACYRLTSGQIQLQAKQPLRGVPESVRIAKLIEATNQCFIDPLDPNSRFIEYRGPQVATVCPPIPTEITNANLPKPSTRCDTLNLLATGVPPNSIVSANR